MTGAAQGDSPRLRVLIAEDQYLTREGTRRLLDERDELEVVGVASDFDSVIAEEQRLRPDVVVMDVKMPPTFTMEGIEAAHTIKRRQRRLGARSAYRRHAARAAVAQAGLTSR